MKFEKGHVITLGSTLGPQKGQVDYDNILKGLYIVVILTFFK